MSDKLAGAGITTIMGMGITFVVLLLLWLCIAIMTKFTYRPKKGGDASQTTNTPAPPSNGAAAVMTEAPAADGNLIAVIAAAVAAYEGGSASNFVVRKIRRVSGDTTAWGNAGRADCIESRKF